MGQGLFVAETYAPHQVKLLPYPTRAYIKNDFYTTVSSVRNRCFSHPVEGACVQVVT